MFVISSEHFRENGKSVSFQKDIKSAVNVVYTWAIEERLIREVSSSPTQGVEVDGRDDEKSLRSSHETRFEHFFARLRNEIISGIRDGL